jgi:hypothetical protein
LPENNLIWIPPPDPIINGEQVVRLDRETLTVSMPLWYWQKIEVYIIATEGNKEKLKPP